MSVGPVLNKLTLERAEAGGGSGEVVPHLVDQVVVVLDPVLLRLHHRGLALRQGIRLTEEQFI